ncbi:poly(A)-specific ribonuclease [Plasmodiophora brassicae]
MTTTTTTTTTTIVYGRHGPPACRTGQLSIVSFNILSQTCLDAHVACGQEDRQYGHVAPACRAWRHRLPLIVSLLTEMSPSIVCLQEVDPDTFHSDFDEWMKARGYASVLQDSRHGVWFVNAILYRYDQVSVVWQESRSRALLVELRTASGDSVLVGNLHLQAMPAEAPTRFCQARNTLKRLRHRLETTGGDPTAARIVLCGDFNADDGGSVSELLRQGSMEPRHVDAESGTVVNDEEFQHPFRFEKVTGSPAPSYVTPGHSHLVDLIFVQNLKVDAVLNPLDGAEELDQVTRADVPPSAAWPSDHLPVGALLTIMR